MLRGYLANAEKVRVRGVEFDSTARVNNNVALYGAATYTDGRYVAFRDAPPPLEDTGGPQVKDVSGSLLAGISKWALSFGGEYVHPRTVLGRRLKLSPPSTGAIGRLLLECERVALSGDRGYSVVNARVASVPRPRGPCTCGRATCSTRRTSSCFPRPPVTPASMSDNLVIRGPIGVDAAFDYKASRN